MMRPLGRVGTSRLKEGSSRLFVSAYPSFLIIREASEVLT